MTYPRPLQMMHWTLAVLVTCQLAVAVVLTQLRSLGYAQLVLSLHRQLGLVILLLVLARLVMPRQHRVPEGASSGLPPWQASAASLVHRALLVLLLVQPLVGIVVAWGRGDALALFGLIDIPAPFEISDTAREKFTTLHIATAITLFALCTVHVGAVVFNRVVRRVSVIERMLPPVPQDRLINRMTLSRQLMLAFSAILGIALLMGGTAVSTYRELNRVTAEYQASDAAIIEQMRSAQVAWRELTVLATLDRADDVPRLRDLAASASSSLEDARDHMPASELRIGVEHLLADIAAERSEEPPRGEAARTVDSALQDLIDGQSAASFQQRTENDETAARGHDLIVVSVLPMVLVALVTGLLLARSVTGSVTRMSALVRSIESDKRDQPVEVIGAGEFAGLTRDILSMRVAVEQRGNAAAEQRARFDAERIRLSEEQQVREIALERRQRVERQAHREQLAADFQLQVSVIVETLASTSEGLSATAGSMAESASTTTERSDNASAGATRTSDTALLIAKGSADLSETAQSVRKNAEGSRARALLAVREAAAATEQIDHLLNAARQIGSITDLIAGVSRQTNLLAINARVEAARAGEVGRSFSVVANEVKDLAEKTRGATKLIEKQIEQVNAAAARSSEFLQNLREMIASFEDASGAIFRATDEQFASTRDLAARASEISASASCVAQDIRAAQDTARTTEEMSGDVVHAAEVMDGQAAHLRVQVERFLEQLRGDGGGVTAASERVAVADPDRSHEARRATSIRSRQSRG